MRFWLGAGVFFLFLFFKNELKLNLKHEWKKVLLLSLIGLSGNSILYHLTLIYLPATLVMILENLSPIFVLFFSFVLLKEKPTFLQILAFLFSLAGLMFIVYGKHALTGIGSDYFLGIVLGVLTGMTFGFYTFFSADLIRPYRKQPIEIIRFLFKIFVISSFTMLPLFIFKDMNKPSNFQQWFWLFEMGIFQSGVSYLFWNYALAYLKTNIVSILFLFTILFTTINELIFLDLDLNKYLIAGGLFIVASGYIISKEKGAVIIE